MPECCCDRCADPNPTELFFIKSAAMLGTLFFPVRTPTYPTDIAFVLDLIDAAKRRERKAA